jgi:hypothetical protein
MIENDDNECNITHKITTKRNENGQSVGTTKMMQENKISQIAIADGM